MQDLTILSDEKLMMAYQEGDEQAFQALYRRHSGKVYGYLRARIRDVAEADDVFQATFLKLHSSRSRYDSSYPFLPWLFTVSRSVMMDHFRKKGRNQEDLDPVALKHAPAHAVEEPASLPDLSALPQNFRRVLELRYGEALSFEEIATRLETSPVNVRQMISRAVKKLKLLMSKTEDT